MNFLQDSFASRLQWCHNFKLGIEIRTGSHKKIIIISNGSFCSQKLSQNVRLKQKNYCPVFYCVFWQQNCSSYPFPRVPQNWTTRNYFPGEIFLTPELFLSYPFLNVGLKSALPLHYLGLHKFGFLGLSFCSSTCSCLALFWIFVIVLNVSVLFSLVDLFSF